jgi:hypothetical protein
VKAIHTYTYQGFLNMVKASELGISRHRPVISKQQQNNNLPIYVSLIPQLSNGTHFEQIYLSV